MNSHTSVIHVANNNRSSCGKSGGKIIILSKKKHIIIVDEKFGADALRSVADSVSRMETLTTDLVQR